MRQFLCKCSFLEIYNETLTDLLSPSDTNLLIREDLKHGVYVENLSELVVDSGGTPPHHESCMYYQSTNIPHLKGLQKTHSALLARSNLKNVT